MKVPSMVLRANSLSEVALHEHPDVLAARAPFVSAKEAWDRTATRAARIRALIAPSRYALEGSPSADELLEARIHAPGIEAEVARATQQFRQAQRCYAETVEAIRSALITARAKDRERLLDDIDDRLDGIVAAVEAVIAYDDRTEQLTERRPDPCGWADVIERVPRWRANRQAP